MIHRSESVVQDRLDSLRADYRENAWRDTLHQLWLIDALAKHSSLHPALRAKCKLAIAELLTDHGGLQECVDAVRQVRESRALVLNEKEPTLTAALFSAEAHALHVSCFDPQARTAYQVAQLASQAHGVAADVAAETLIRSAQNLHRLGDFQGGFELLKQARRLAESSGSRRVQFYTVLRLANNALAIPRRSTAFRLLEHAGNFLYDAGNDLTQMRERDRMAILLDRARIQFLVVGEHAPEEASQLCTASHALAVKNHYIFQAFHLERLAKQLHIPS